MADDEYSSIHGLDIVIDNIREMGGGAREYLGAVVERCLTLDVMPVWKEHISLQDHSLEDLRKLGHPYSIRFPKDSLHPDWEVHEQSGTLMDATRIEQDGDSWKIINSAPEYVFLRYGTRNMRPRDPGGHVLAEALPAIKARFAQEVKGAVVQFFKS